MENGLGQEFRVARPSGVRGRWGGVVGVFVALQNLIRSRFLLHQGSFHFGSRRSQSVPLHRLQFRVVAHRTKKSVRYFDMVAGHLGFVVELASKLVKAHVRNSAGEPAVFQHALHIQLFDGNPGKVLRQIARQLVQAVLANTANAVRRRRFVELHMNADEP